MLQLNIEHNLKMNNIFSQKLNLIECKRCMNEVVNNIGSGESLVKKK